jgi:hypothetical protein
MSVAAGGAGLNPPTASHNKDNQFGGFQNLQPPQAVASAGFAGAIIQAATRKPS